MENKGMKILGILVSIVNILLLMITLLFTNIYETYDDELINDINENGVLVRCLFLSIIIFLSLIYICVNRFKRNKFIVTLILFLLLLSTIILIKTLPYYQG